jgi:WASH complex subunit 7
VRTLRIGQSLIDLRAEVSFHLESTFYNLTTVALHDWKVRGAPVFFFY